MASLMAQRAFTASRPVAVRAMAVMVRPTTLVGRSVVARPSTTSSSFLGGSFVGSALTTRAPARGSLVVVAGGTSMGCTKRGTNRKRRRVSGFRARMKTASGRKLLAKRRARGRKVLCPASLKKSGGKK